MKKVCVCLFIISIFISTFFTNSFVVKAEEVTDLFEQGEGYQQGGYDIYAIQPTDHNWTRQSRFLGPQNLVLKWEFSAGWSIKSGPAIANDGTIYFGSEDNKLYALDPVGNLKWTYETGGDIQKSSPVIGSDGTIYFGSFDRYLYAINPDGTLKWKYFASTSVSTDTITSSPSIGSDGTVYVSSGHNIYAVYGDGTLKWIYPVEGCYPNTPVISNTGTVYITANGEQGYIASKLIALDSNGNVQWDIDLGFYADSCPVIGADGTIYCSYFGTFLAIQPDGSEKWRFLTNVQMSSSPAIGFDGTIYVATRGDSFYALNPDGSIKWQVDDAIFNHSSAPLISSDGYVYIGAENKFIIIDSNGNKIDELLQGEFYSSPALGPDKTIYIGSNDFNLYAFTEELKTSTITFDSNGGSLVDAITLEEGAVVIPPTDPIRDGYTFAGWLPALPETMPIEDIIVVAQWTENPPAESISITSIFPINVEYSDVTTIRARLLDDVNSPIISQPVIFYIAILGDSTSKTEIGRGITNRQGYAEIKYQVKNPPISGEGNYNVIAEAYSGSVLSEPKQMTINKEILCIGYTGTTAITNKTSEVTLSAKLTDDKSKLSLIGLSIRISFVNSGTYYDISVSSSGTASITLSKAQLSFLETGVNPIEVRLLDNPFYNTMPTVATSSLMVK